MGVPPKSGTRRLGATQTELSAAPATTVRGAVKLERPAWAVMVTVPGALATTAPEDETVATSVRQLDQVTAWPSRSLPPESQVDAERLKGVPTATASRC